MKRAQLAVPFHWIFVLIAGAIILIFFLSLVTKQKSVADAELAITVKNKLDNILSSSLQGDRTVHVTQIPELELSFMCDGDLSSFTVLEESRDTPYQPIFAPENLYTDTLIIWSEDFSAGFKVSNLMLVGSPSVSYYVVSTNSNPLFQNTLMTQIPDQFSFSEIDSIERLVPATDHVKLIFLEDVPLTLKEPLASLPNGHVSAVKVGLGGEGVTYYEKQGTSLVRKASVPILSSDTNAVLYAAIFSDNAESFYCNMGKVYERLSMLSSIYKDRIESIRQEYLVQGVTRCSSQSISTHFENLKAVAAACQDSPQNCNVQSIESYVISVENQNTNLLNSHCASLY